MAEINHRYLKDNDGDTYFPITHIDAVQGWNQESEDNALTDMNDKINQMNTLIDNANKKIAEQKKIIDCVDMAIEYRVGDTCCVDITLPPANKNNAVGTGFKSGIREVRAGNSLMPHTFIVRSIRLNVSNIKGNSMQIPQLPT